MTRLERELRRLYLPAASAAGRDAAPPGPTCRAFALELARPGDWSALSAAWKGVQAELDLPAPAIALNGRDGLQLWFSLAEAVDEPQALAFLGALSGHYLAATPDHRVAHLTAAWSEDRAPVPARVDDRRGAGADMRWTAFVAPDLAAVFDDTPWLEMSPSEEGQADLLSRLKCIRPDEWAAARARLGVESSANPQGPSAAPGAAAAPTASAASVASTGSTQASSSDEVAAELSAPAQARHFLLSVMHDASAPLAQRVEAATALLAHGGRAGSGRAA